MPDVGEHDRIGFSGGFQQEVKSHRDQYRDDDDLDDQQENFSRENIRFLQREEAYRRVQRNEQRMERVGEKRQDFFQGSSLKFDV